MIGSDSIILFENPEYGVRLEYNADFAIVHLPYTNKMTKEVFLDMQIKLEEWSKFLKTAGYTALWASIDPNNQKMVKLVSMLNFKYVGTAEGQDVYSYGGM